MPAVGSYFVSWSDDAARRRQRTCAKNKRGRANDRMLEAFELIRRISTRLLVRLSDGRPIRYSTLVSTIPYVCVCARYVFAHTLYII